MRVYDLLKRKRYANRVREKREKLNLTLKEFALLIEKISIKNHRKKLSCRGKQFVQLKNKFINLH